MCKLDLFLRQYSDILNLSYLALQNQWRGEFLCDRFVIRLLKNVVGNEESWSDPVVSGFVTNLAHPGGNITGVTIDAPGLSGKRLELLKESFPRLSRVAVLHYPATHSSKVTMEETEQAARLLNVHLQPVGVETSNELENAFSAMNKKHAEALIKLPSAVLTSYRKQIVELAAKNRLPAMYA